MRVPVSLCSPLTLCVCVCVWLGLGLLPGFIVSLSDSPHSNDKMSFLIGIGGWYPIMWPPPPLTHTDRLICVCVLECLTSLNLYSPMDPHAFHLMMLLCQFLKFFFYFCAKCRISTTVTSFPLNFCLFYIDKREETGVGGERLNWTQTGTCDVLNPPGYQATPNWIFSGWSLHFCS